MSDRHSYRRPGVSRRQALSWLAAAAAFALPARSGSAAPPFATPAIDVHHHFLPPGYKKRAADWLHRHATGAEAVLGWTPERSLSAMDEARIETAVLSISAPGVHFGDAAAARATARECNEYAARLAADHPGRFRFFLALPMPDVQGSTAEIGHAAKHYRHAGVGLLSNYDGRHLGDPQFRPLFEQLNEIGALVYVHPTTAPCCLGLVPEMPTPLIEFPVDTARTIASLLWSGTLSRFQRIRFVFSHGAGALPMLIERVSAAGLLNPELAARVPEGPAAALARLYVDTASITYAAALRALEAWLPADHVLYGTDYPWGAPRRARAALTRLGISAQRLAAIERGNALKLLGEP